jgi:hypothetical protein
MGENLGIFTEAAISFLEVAEKFELEYLVIGGVAVFLQG